MNLNADQRQAVFSGEAIRIQEAGVECVVVRADVFDRVKNLLYDASSWTPEELRQQLAKSAEMNGWNEPAMDDYDHYDEELQKRCP